MRKICTVLLLLLTVPMRLIFGLEVGFTVNGIIATDNQINGMQIIKALEGIDLDTQFLIGSITKQFTGFLATRFLPDLEDFAANYFSEQDLSELINVFAAADSHSGNFQREPVKIFTLRELKIIHLLHHATGINCISGEKFADPGERFHYDNFNYALLGRILENVTGRPYGELCADLFQEVGMAHSSVLNDVNLPDLPQQFPGLRASLFMSPWANVPLNALQGKWSQVVSPAGGIISTPRDLLRWNRFMAKNENENYKKIISQSMDMADGNAYGFGIIKNPSGILGHSGQIVFNEEQVYHSVLFYNPNNGKSCVILENVPSREEIALKIVEL